VFPRTKEVKLYIEFFADVNGNDNEWLGLNASILADYIEGERPPRKRQCLSIDWGLRLEYDRELDEWV